MQDFQRKQGWVAQHRSNRPLLQKLPLFDDVCSTPSHELSIVAKLTTQKMLLLLTPLQRQTVVLINLGGMTAVEASRVLGLKADTLVHRHADAMRKLRKMANDPSDLTLRWGLLPHAQQTGA